jgi:hypothetical protein
VVGLGAYHGVNPGMGWLFAVALGLQQGRARAVLAALPPIALGHAAALLAVASVLAAAGAVLSPGALSVATALCLLGFGVYKLVRYYRHPRWVGMRVGARDLVAWSFLMATAHGAGLMLAPLLVGLGTPAASAAPALVGHAGHALPASGGAAGLAWALAIGLHTLVLLAVMTAVAWVVYSRVGLAILRRGWVNFDLIWAAALIVVGALALAAAV